ncbi:hypothetical protein ETD86_29065 [Nonomuraea turkmeniaca]|uniref:Uncharacterized protein n=1 Tax=Nonomuraea turkmeniaca TaxID=103838 RepID=A0A5S4FBM5_9ACTN|nr:hypothetical protein [Nonomuraea turkmeniaca]TMR14316.1 hypothetical protein ETD86_29065 [Nonomuraea turkmeniaca]
MHVTDARYELYGLPSGNPYASRPLDPLACEEDRHRLFDLEGFIRSTAIEATVESAAATDRPAFFLITGMGNSGRTSLANHVMYRYQHARTARLPPFRFVTHYAERGEMTHDAYRTLRSTLLSLRAKMRVNQIDVPPPLAEMFTELSRRPRAQAMDDYELQEIADYAAAIFAAHDMGFGVRYEGVATKELITLATRVFENASTVVVFTVDNYRHATAVQLTRADRQEFARRGHITDLSPLSPAQIAALADHRWTGHPPSPFDSAGVLKAFQEHPCTIGQALRHLYKLLDTRLRQYDGDEPWPTDGLRIHEHWLLLHMSRDETWYGPGGFHG